MKIHIVKKQNATKMASGTILFAGMVSVLLLCPQIAESNNHSSVVVNDSFFDGSRIAPNTRILIVTVDTETLIHGDADAELIQYPKPGAERLANSCGLDSSPPVPFTLDCGVKMLGLETRGSEAVYYFLLKAHKGDWYQIVLSPQSGATTWIKDPHADGLGIFTRPLYDWLQSQDAYQTAHEITDVYRAVPVMLKPEDASKDLTDCAGYGDWEGLIPAEDKARHGDWVHVICLEHGCYSTNDPVSYCISDMNLPGALCVQGWARWRSKEGHLLLYTHDALDQGC
jgi:hypothetical protein